MRDYEQKILDAIIVEFKQTGKSVKIRKIAKRMGLPDDFVIDVCERLKKSKYIKYDNVADRTAPKNEYVYPTMQTLR